MLYGINDNYIAAIEKFNNGFRSTNQKRKCMADLNSTYTYIKIEYKKKIMEANSWRSNSEFSAWAATSDFKSMLLPDSLSAVSERDILNVIRVNSQWGLILRDILTMCRNVKNIPIFTQYDDNNIIIRQINKRITNIFAEHKTRDVLQDIDVSDILKDPVTVNARRVKHNSSETENVITYFYKGKLVPLMDILESRLDNF